MMIQLARTKGRDGLGHLGVSSLAIPSRLAIASY
jgi:hypothetical protein